MSLPKMERTAQSYALGDGGSYLRGLNALGTNPAGLHSGLSEFLAQYQQLPLSSRLTWIGGSRALKGKDATLGISYLGLSSDGFEGRSQTGEETGDFSSQEQIISMHWAHEFTVEDAWGRERKALSVGASVKWLRMEIGQYRGEGYALDMGGRYSFRRVPLTLGIAVTNLGKGPAFVSESSKLPSRVTVSGSYPLLRSVTAIGTVGQGLNDEEREISLGFESTLAGIFNLRGRYGLNQGVRSQGGLNNFVGGLGFQVFKKHSLDYSFQPYSEDLNEAGTAGTHRLTLTFRFGKESPQAGPSRHGLYGRREI